MRTTIPFDEITKEWKKDPAFRQEYDKLKPEFELARELIHARVRARLTQAEIAKRMGTTQSVVARIESGRNSITLKTLGKYAEATGSHLSIKLKAN